MPSIRETTGIDRKDENGVKLLNLSSIGQSASAGS